MKRATRRRLKSRIGKIRWTLFLVVLLLALALEAGSAHGQEQFTRDDMIEALDHYEATGGHRLVRRIVYCECRYDPNVETLLFLGCAQLMKGEGNGYAIFQRWGGTNWRDPGQVVWFIDQVIERRMLNSQYPNTQYGCTGSP